jgi:hypothetical protein
MVKRDGIACAAKRGREVIQTGAIRRTCDSEQVHHIRSQQPPTKT